MRNRTWRLHASRQSAVFVFLIFLWTGLEDEQVLQACLPYRLEEVHFPHLSLSFTSYATHHRPIPHTGLHCPFCSPSLLHQLCGDHLDHCSPAILLMTVLQGCEDRVRNPTWAARMQAAKPRACLPWRFPGVLGRRARDLFSAYTWQDSRRWNLHLNAERIRNCAGKCRA